MKTVSDEYELMETHGPLATKIALWFTMFSPFIGVIVAFLGAWFFRQLSG